jgi:iron(III) transport system ATP-binding protein
MTHSSSPDMTASDRPQSVDSIQQKSERRSPPSGTAPSTGLGHPYLQIENVHKNFGKFIALRDIYLNVYPGEFLCLLGPSGCGKTTLLRIIAGLEEQTSGRVIQADKDVSRLPPAKRDFGIMFQSYALFPNLTAAQNIAYGLQNAKEPKQRIRTRVEELLNLVSLEGIGHKYPSQMSGGQQQRVALARALALSPGLLLLDEPLSALDAQVRVKLRAEIVRLQKQLGITTVMVTHDQAEALAMADRIVVMDKGYIAQIGAPQSVYQRPNTPFVANFIGVTNFLHGVVASTEQVRCGNIVLTATQNTIPPDNPVLMAIRPENIRVLAEEELDNLTSPNILKAEVEGVEFLGSGYRATLRPDGDSKELLTVDLSSHEAASLDLSLNSCLNIHIPPDLIQIFPA